MFQTTEYGKSYGSSSWLWGVAFWVGIQDISIDSINNIVYNVVTNEWATSWWYDALAARPLLHLVLAIIIIAGQMPNVGDILCSDNWNILPVIVAPTHPNRYSRPNCRCAAANTPSARRCTCEPYAHRAAGVHLCGAWGCCRASRIYFTGKLAVCYEFVFVDETRLSMQQIQ